MLNYSWRRHVPVVLQTEAAECGLACLAMIASFHGHQIDLASLRARHAVSLRGSSLADLMRIAGMLKMTPRPLRLELPDMGKLALPCVLHWDFNHFVVLVKVNKASVTLHDPAAGLREMTWDECSSHFTGVAMELRPSDGFAPMKEERRIGLPGLMGRVAGLLGMLGQVLALALVLQVFALMAPFQMQLIVDQALVSRDQDLVMVLGAGFLLLAVIQAGVMGLRGWLLMVLSTTLNMHMSGRLLRHLIRLPMAWFERRHMGDIVSRFDALQVIQRQLTSSFVEALIDGLMAILTLGMMVMYAPKLALVAVLATLGYAALRLLLHRPMQLSTHEHIIRSARQQSHFLETVRGMQSIKLFNHADARAMTWQNLAVAQHNAGIKTQRLVVVGQACNTLLFGLENVLTIWLGALMVLDSTKGSGFSVGMLFAFVSYKTQFVQRVGALIEKGMEWRMLRLHTDRVADIACAETEAGDEAVLTAPHDIQGQIAFHHVSFRYGDAEPLVLHDLSFHIQSGDSVAIVGPSGCGKTTLVKLLLGLLQPTEGAIEIDGQPLSQVGLARWRQSVATVMQDDVLFAGSIAENICFFEAVPDHALIEQCAKMAAIHADIVLMPMQYNTLVGDMGTVLSGGQKQRVLMARALYRQPRVLLLDEATSHLDVASERHVNEAIRALNLTRIIVAHRPETIASADRVLYLRADAELMLSQATPKARAGSPLA